MYLVLKGTIIRFYKNEADARKAKLMSLTKLYFLLYFHVNITVSLPSRTMLFPRADSALRNANETPC